MPAARGSLGETFRGLVGLPLLSPVGVGERVRPLGLDLTSTSTSKDGTEDEAGADAEAEVATPGRASMSADDWPNVAVDESAMTRLCLPGFGRANFVKLKLFTRQQAQPRKGGPYG